jgi:hypothetical protein
MGYTRVCLRSRSDLGIRLRAKIRFLNAYFQSSPYIFHQVRVCGDKDERDAYTTLLQTPFGFYPAKTGHTNVADDQIWLEIDSRGH